MKQILTVLMLFFYGVLQSQIYTPSVPTSYGSHNFRLKADSVLHVPAINDFLVHSNDNSPQIRVISGQLKLYNNGTWSNVGGLSGYTETDPIFLAHVSSSITPSDITNWNNGNIAFSWGNHASSGYLTSVDSTVFSTKKWRQKGIDSVISVIGARGYITSYNETDPLSVKITDSATMLSKYLRKSDTTNKWQPKGSYLTSYTETDPVFLAHVANTITGTNISNWNSAYGWGNHALAGYLTSYGTLQQVTTAGNSTTDSLLINRLGVALHFRRSGGSSTAKDWYIDNNASSSLRIGTSESGDKLNIYDSYIDIPNGVIRLKNRQISDTFITTPTDSKFYLPKNGGQTLAISVNNSFADSLGNIALSSFDSSGLSNRINLKKNISDSVHIVGSDYVRQDRLKMVVDSAVDRTSLILGSYTTTQRDALSPTVGQQIYNSTNGYLEYYDSFWGWLPIGISNDWRRKFGIEYFNDFVGHFGDANTGDGFLLWSGQNAGSTFDEGGTPTNGRIGIGRHLSGTTATGSSVVRTNKNSNSFVAGGGIFATEADINFTTLSTLADRFTYVFGIGEFAITTRDQVNGIYFIYDEGGTSSGSAVSANFQIVSAKGSVRTFTTTSIAVAASTWYKLRIEVNAACTSATFYINGVSVGTITTNLPAGNATNMGSGLYSSTYTSSQKATWIDYFSFKQKFNTVR